MTSFTNETIAIALQPSAKVKKVYAGLANGTVVVVGCAGHGDQQSHSEVNLVVEDDSDERVKREAETWHNTQVRLFQLFVISFPYLQEL